jgi:hypothetical protein
MTDSQRALEKKALHNVRALSEMLERDDLWKRKRQTRALLIAAVPIALVLVMIITTATVKPPDAAANQRRGCELDAWNATAAEYERQARRDNPDLAYRDIQKGLERERPFLMAKAAVACNAKAR